MTFIYSEADYIQIYGCHTSLHVVSSISWKNVDMPTSRLLSRGLFASLSDDGFLLRVNRNKVSFRWCEGNVARPVSLIRGSDECFAA